MQKTQIIGKLKNVEIKLETSHPKCSPEERLFLSNLLTGPHKKSYKDIEREIMCMISEQIKNNINDGEFYDDPLAYYRTACEVYNVKMEEFFGYLKKDKKLLFDTPYAEGIIESLF